MFWPLFIGSFRFFFLVLLCGLVFLFLFCFFAFLSSLSFFRCHVLPFFTGLFLCCLAFLCFYAFLVLVKVLFDLVVLVLPAVIPLGLEVFQLFLDIFQLFSIGFVIIDFPLAIGFGLFIGLLNMVPYLQLVALVPTVLLSLLKAADTGENFWWILACALLVFCIVQIIQDAIIVPKVMGKITGLNPAIILLSLSIWGALMGIVGMIIALPCTTIILSYYKRYIKKQEESNTLIF